MFDFDPFNFGPEDLNRIAQESEDAIKRLEGMTAELGEVVGEGEACDGQIQVTVESSGRLRHIELDPRAMRMDVRTFEDELLAAVLAAQDDANRQTSELVEEALEGGPLAPGSIDVEKFGSKLKEIEESFNRSMADRFTNLDQIRKKMEQD